MTRSGALGSRLTDAEAGKGRRCCLREPRGSPVATSADPLHMHINGDSFIGVSGVV